MTRMGSASQGDTPTRPRTVNNNRGGGALYSDYYEDEREEPLGPQRSISLSALHSGSTAPLEPRMAQLETLEAKMASIEVSLSTTPRRKKPNTASTTPTPPATTTPTISSTPNLFRPAKDVAHELEMLRTTLRDKDNVIHSLKGQLCTSLSLSRLSASFLSRQQPPALTDKERRAAEDRLTRLRNELDAKRLAIKNIKLALERLDITDNIDVRIQQAELEYQLGREELNLLSILEESRNLTTALEDSASNHQAATIYSYVKASSAVTLHSVELVYDPKSPRFGASPRDDGSGLYVDWATEDSGLIKGDRLLEVNGKLAPVPSKEDLHRLLAISPNPAQLVVMRRQPPHLEQLMSTLRAELLTVREKAGEAERTRDSFRSDNLRLTHRISYLEEQVAELLGRSSLTNQTSHNVKSAAEVDVSSAKSELQVFQKGSQVTTLVPKLEEKRVENLIVSSLNGKSSEERKKERVKSAEKISTEDKVRRKKKEHLSTTKSTNSLDVDASYKYNYVEKSKALTDYSSTSERKSSRKNSENHKVQMEQRQRHIREARSSLFDFIERDKSGKYDFDSEPSITRPSSCQPNKADTMSQKSLDYSSECSGKYYKKNSSRPIPPKKPMRLSLHRATSLQSVEVNDKKILKRNHKGENSLGLWPSAVASLHNAANYCSKTSLTEKWC